MRVEYRRTFSQFVDNYLSGYYSQSGKQLVRLLGGPFQIFLGAILLILGRNPETLAFLRVLLYLAGAYLIVRGAALMLRPWFEIFLVWLRRDEFLGAEGTLITIELFDDKLRVSEDKDTFDVPLENVLHVQRRAASTWIVTQPDNLLFIPNDSLLSGDHDAFVDALEELLAEDEEE